MREDNMQTIGTYALPALHVPLAAARRAGFYPVIKRAMDVIIAAAIGIPVLIIIAVLALLVRTDGHPAFYSQPRLGRAGTHFRLWKLRTMVPDADRKLREHLDANPEAKDEWDRTQKLHNDPRITPVGKVLRKYSLDELPQLWNVLRGDMSLVGPRPMFPEQRASYPGNDYFSLRPGMTGLWQISVRNRSSFAERAIYDSVYAQKLSMITDLRILARTPLIMLLGTGI